MTNETKYKIKAPVSNRLMDKDVMTEKELREFIPTLIQDSDQAQTWEEKAAKDPIEDLIEWLGRAGYQIEKLK